MSGYGGESGSIRLNGSMFDGLEILEHPESAPVEVGGEILLTANVKGVPPLVYQWFRDGLAIDGATGPAYRITDAGEEDAGEYTLMVSNTFDHLTSDAATVTVYRDPPRLLSGPTSQHLVPGSTLHLTASAEGTPPLNYQWFFEGEELPGAQQSDLTIPLFGPEHAGRYEVSVTNDAGGVRSGPAYLDLSNSPFATWRFRNGNGPAIYAESTVAFGDDVYLFQDNRVVRTRDGLIWQTAALPIDEDRFSLSGEIQTVIVSDSLMVAEYYEKGILSYYSSSDGLNWTYLPTPAYSHSLAEFQGTWYLIGYQGGDHVLYRSDDLISWTVEEDVDPYKEFTLVEAGSDWRYRVESDPEVSYWYGKSYDSSAWPTGTAEFGYGEGDKTTVIPDVAGMSSVYFIQPFLNEPGYWKYDIQGRIKYQSTATVRLGGRVLYQDSTQDARDPMGEWVPIPVVADVNLPITVDPDPFSVEVGKSGSALSFDLELTASTWVGLYKPVAGEDRVIILKRNGDVFVSSDGTTWTTHATRGILDPEAAGRPFLPFDDEPAFLLGTFVGWDTDTDTVYFSEDGIIWESHPWPKVVIPIFSSTTSLRVPFGNAAEMVERDGNVIAPLGAFSNSNIVTSDDLLNWTVQTLPVDPDAGDPGQIRSLVLSDAGYFFAQFGNREFGVYSSPEDIVIPESSASMNVSRLRVLDGNLVTFSHRSPTLAWFSPDAEKWTRFHGGSKDAVYANGTYTALNRWWNGSVWIERAPFITGNSTADWAEENRVAWPFTWEPWTLQYHGGRYIAAGVRGGIATSPDAETWTLIRAATDLSGTILHSEVLNGVWLGMTDQGSLITSHDAVTFSEVPLSTPQIVGSISGGTAAAAYGNGVYLVCVENNDEMKMYRSADLITWQRIRPAGNGNPSGVAFGQGWFVAVEEERLFFSENGIEWQSGSLPGGKGRYVIHHLDSFWVGVEHGVFWNTEMGEFPDMPSVRIAEMEERFLYNSEVRFEAEAVRRGADIDRMELWIDGVLVHQTISDSIRWESADLSPGSHVAVVKVYDPLGRAAVQWQDLETAFSPDTNVMPGALQHPDRFVQVRDGTFFGFGREVIGSVAHGAYLARSVDGALWNEVRSIQKFDDLRDFSQLIQMDNGLLLAGHMREDLLLSGDGLNWESLEDVELSGVLVTNGDKAFMLPSIVNGSSFKTSTDGRTWQQEILIRTGGSPSSHDWSVASWVYWKDRFIVLGRQRGAAAVSTDGINWIADNPFPTFGLQARLVAGREAVVTFAPILGTGSYPDWETEYGMTAYVTEDGFNWTPLSEKTSLEFRNLQSVDGTFYGINTDGIWRSDNLTDWDHLSDLDEANRFLLDAQLFSSPAGFLAIDLSGSTHRSSARTVAQSADLVTWEILQSYPDSQPLDLVADSGTFVTNVGSGLLRSTNGRNWIQLQVEGVDTFLDLHFADGKWVALGKDQDSGMNRILWSEDLETWAVSDVTTDTLNPYTEGRILFLNGVWLVVDRSQVWRSTDLETWNAVSAPADMPFTEGNDGVIEGKILGGRFVLLHHDGFFSSLDGESWNYLHWYSYRPYYSNSLYKPYNLRFVDGFYVYPSAEGSGGPGATHVRSLDLTSWEEVPGFQKMVNEPRAWIGEIGLANFDNDPFDSSTSKKTHITLDGGDSYLQLEGGLSVSDIVASDDAFYICKYNSITEMSLIDLAVENTAIHTTLTPGPGVPVTVEFDVTNKGWVAYNRSGELKVSVMLSPKGYLDGSRSIPLFETVLQPPLASGDSLHIRQEVLIPRTLPAGEFHLGVYVDATDILSELNEENNLYFSPEPLIDIPHVTLTINQTAGGSVTSGSSLPEGLLFSEALSGGGISVLSGDLLLPFNMQLDLIANPHKNYMFVGWEELFSSEGDLLNLTLTRDLTLTPIFRNVISVRTFTRGKGTVLSIPANLTDLDEGVTVQLTAVPDPGWTFLKWEGDVASTETSVSLTANNPKQVQAVFYKNHLRFDDWKSEVFTEYETPNPLVSGMREDPDGDGYSNLMEFLLRTNPKDPGDKPAIRVHFRGNTVDFEFETDPRITNYEAVIVSSSDLKQWNRVTAVEDETTTHRYDRAGRRICAPLEFGESTIRFYRLQFKPVE